MMHEFSSIILRVMRITQNQVIYYNGGNSLLVEKIIPYIVDISGKLYLENRLTICDDVLKHHSLSMKDLTSNKILTTIDDTTDIGLLKNITNIYIFGKRGVTETLTGNVENIYFMRGDVTYTFQENNWVRYHIPLFEGLTVYVNATHPRHAAISQYLSPYHNNELLESINKKYIMKKQ